MYLIIFAKLPQFQEYNQRSKLWTFIYMENEHNYFHPEVRQFDR